MKDTRKGHTGDGRATDTPIIDHPWRDFTILMPDTETETTTTVRRKLVLNAAQAEHILRQWAIANHAMTDPKIDIDTGCDFIRGIVILDETVQTDPV